MLWITLITDIKTADKEILGKIKAFLKVAVTEFRSNAGVWLKTEFKHDDDDSPFVSPIVLYGA
jgi:hypothetical protein